MRAKDRSSLVRHLRGVGHRCPPRAFTLSSSTAGRGGSVWSIWWAAESVEVPMHQRRTESGSKVAESFAILLYSSLGGTASWKPQNESNGTYLAFLLSPLYSQLISQELVLISAASTPQEKVLLWADAPLTLGHKAVGPMGIRL